MEQSVVDARRGQAAVIFSFIIGGPKSNVSIMVPTAGIEPARGFRPNGF
jgi:hypothetical protein